MRVTTALAFLALASGAASQSPGADPAVQHAAQTVAHLHDTMLDPASFVLDAAFITKPNKRGEVSYCYEFRSHNKMGGYSEGRAVEDGGDHLRLSVLTLDDGYGKYQGYDVGWVAPCKSKNVDRIMTEDVAALATPLYRKTK
jgi:hypothetical protein